ncbi:hypothetical protein CVT25_011785 [Psilocybe cyanescens]|uniref:Uncharacterized protein n=1 Tax=Psilocybe cyanescens TaxID=93625 RepID=A0A409WJ72_PSICY|nr:hypothetical protein CVT25_011785 [Psilocybe cyanescens]
MQAAREDDRSSTPKYVYMHVPNVSAADNAARLARLQELLAEALTTAKAVVPTHHRHATIRKVHQTIGSLLAVLPEDRNSNARSEYNAHKRALNKSMDALRSSCEIEGLEALDKQGLLIGDIVDELSEWIPNIWYNIADTNAEEADEDLAQDSLRSCSIATSAMQDCPEAAGFYNYTGRLTILDPDDEDDDNIIYDDYDACMTQNLAWMWRELLVFMASRNRSTDCILEDIRVKGFTNEVFGFIRQPGEETNADGYQFWDAHWTDSMKKAAAVLCSKRRSQMAR